VGPIRRRGRPKNRGSLGYARDDTKSEHAGIPGASQNPHLISPVKSASSAAPGARPSVCDTSPQGRGNQEGSGILPLRLRSGLRLVEAESSRSALE